MGKYDSVMPNSFNPYPESPRSEATGGSRDLPNPFKGNELADSDRAHSGKAGSKVKHGQDARGTISKPATGSMDTDSAATRSLKLMNAFDAPTKVSAQKKAAVKKQKGK